MITQFATSDDPPYDRNGVVSPVSGISRVTPPITTNTWIANWVMIALLLRISDQARRPPPELFAPDDDTDATQVVSLR